jgi:hypothetical protein
MRGSWRRVEVVVVQSTLEPTSEAVAFLASATRINKRERL